MIRAFRATPFLLDIERVPFLILAASPMKPSHLTFNFSFLKLRNAAVSFGIGTYTHPTEVDVLDTKSEDYVTELSSFPIKLFNVIFCPQERKKNRFF